MSAIRQISLQKQPLPCFFYPMAGKMKMSISELLTDAEKQKLVLVEIAESYPVGAVIRMTELWCEAAAFGMECHISDDTFPQLGKPLYTDIGGLAGAYVPETVNKITGPLIEAVRLAVPCIDKPMIVGATGPYTLGSVLCGSEDFMMHCMTEPEAVHTFLEKATTFLIEYISAYKSAGASAVMLAEPSTSMISPDMMAELSNAYVKKITDSLQDDNFSVIYHNCGAVNRHLEVIGKLDVDAFHFGSDVDLKRAFSCTGDDKMIMGNIDPRLFISSSPSEIERMTRNLLEQNSTAARWRLSTGCDLSPKSSIENVEAFLKTAETHSAK